MRFLLLSTMVLVSAACRSSQPREGWPDPDWASVRPAELGLDSAALAALDAEFAAGKYGYVDGMVVTRRGLLAYEASYTHDYGQAYAGRDTVSQMYNYYDPAWHPFYQGTRLHTLQSVTKSLTSVVFGVAQRRGDLPALLDAPVLSFFDSTTVANLDDRKRRLTVRHLLTMTAGFDWDESTVTYTDPRNNCAVMEASPDWVKYVIDRPMAAEPGTVFVYNSGATQLLAHVFLKATGQDIGQYAEQYLFGPLGITRYYWKRTPTGLPDTEGGLYLEPRDLARIGLLYLRGGRWRDQQLVPAEWVTASTTPAIPAREMQYGFKWWLLPRSDRPGAHGWLGLGYGGQRLIVLPEEEIVAVFTGWNIDEHPSLPAAEMVARLVEATAAP